MSVKYFCDRCGYEIREGTPNRTWKGEIKKDKFSENAYHSPAVVVLDMLTVCHYCDGCYANI